MRNVRGYKFPHRCSEAECRSIAAELIESHRSSTPDKWKRGIGPRERDEWVGQCLVSHDFPYQRTGRALWFDDDSKVSVMVNEEDHLRLQVLVGGWALKEARNAAYEAVGQFGDVEFAHHPSFGYLAASPHNCGDGMRLSAMFHLMALANTKRLLKVIEALDALNVSTRGLLGESSRAIGAFVQVSVPRNDMAAIQAAGEVLIQEERLERALFSDGEVVENTVRAMEAVIASRALSLADAYRAMGWIRWCACLEETPLSILPLQVDVWRTSIEFGTGQDPHRTAVGRATALRKLTEPLYVSLRNSSNSKGT